MKQHIEHARSASSWNIVAGLLLFVTPFIFKIASSTATSTDDYIVGGIVVIFASLRLLTPNQSVWASWVNAVLGIWLIVSPLVFRLTNMGFVWTNVILGLIISLLASVNIAETRNYSRGHFIYLRKR